MGKRKPYPGTNLCVDIVIIESGQVLMEKRVSGDYAGYWCLPGGHVEPGETTISALKRELKEETGLSAKPVFFVGLYTGKGRFPGCDTASCAFFCKLTGGKRKLQKEEVADMEFFPIDSLPKKTAFDHRRILADAVSMLKGKRKEPVIS